MQRIFFLLFCMVSNLMLIGCDLFENERIIKISGQTMGTYYNVIAIGNIKSMDETALQAEVNAVLADVNAKMSNWDKASEVSRFNTSSQSSPIKISGDMLTVMVEANDIYHKTGGKFDVTLGPLIELWGFGTRKPEDPVPSNQDIKKALALVGQKDSLELDVDASTIKKLRPHAEINLSALAKGFGIDAVASKLTALGYKHYLVEVGGDLRTAGLNAKGQTWRVGIERPEPGTRELKKIVAISNQGMATSGDYRIFIEADGLRYSHIIDPSTGRPITHWTTSVSVIADNAMKADAWATALLVLGSDEGLKVANEHDVAAYFISRNRDDNGLEYVIQSSDAFEKRVETHKF